MSGIPPEAVTNILTTLVLTVVSATYRKIQSVEKWRRRVDTRLARIEAKISLTTPDQES